MDELISLETKRLTLRKITPELIIQLFEEKTYAEIEEFFDTDPQGFMDLKDMYENRMETYNISQLYFLLIKKENNKIIGDCGFHTWNKKHNRAEAFYSLKKDEDKRQGYMTEALAEVLAYGFNELNLHRIQALVADNNIASKRLLQHFNFKLEGVSREDYCVNGKNEDSTIYSLLKPEWIKNKIKDKQTEYI